MTSVPRALPLNSGTRAEPGRGRLESPCVIRIQLGVGEGGLGLVSEVWLLAHVLLIPMRTQKTKFVSH